MNNANCKSFFFIIIILILSCDEILTPYPPDCAGVQDGNAILDDCEQCVSGTTGLSANYLKDCLGVCSGSATLDNCEICDSDPDNDCVKDCAGNWGGTAKLDECGVCNGGQTDGDVNDDGENCETDCLGGIDALDCLGVCNGSATLDNCGICDSDPSNDCNQDCLGMLGGTAKLDECGVCNGGQDDGDVNGDGENCETDCLGGIDALDCLGVCNGNATLDNCEVCDSNVSNDCIEDCADVWGGGALDFDSDGICDIDESNPWGDVSYHFDNITDESVTLKYTSNVDVYGFEFDVTGIVLTNVTSNLDGISLSNGGDNVLGISLSGSFLASGTGTAAVLYFEPSPSGFTLSISNIIFAGRSAEFNAVELSISGTSSTIISACSLNSYGCCGSLINGTWYADTDGDGLGDETVTWTDCSAAVPAGYVVDNIDEDDNCRSASYFDDLGDGYCDTIILVLDCAEYNCDNGDCGTWNGYACMGDDGLAAIKYDWANIGPGPPYSIYTEDLSIPNPFYWNQYYPAIPGTYLYSYIGDQATTDEYFFGYYTTFINSGDTDNICFELKMYNYNGPSFYDWPDKCYDIEPVIECANYFNNNCSDLSRSNDSIDPDIGLEYERYLSDQTREKNMIDIYGTGGNNAPNTSPTITKIDNPLMDIRISEIDNDPDVIFQQGKNYIMKYVKREINP